MSMFDAVEITAIGILIIVLFIGLFWLSMRIDALERRMLAGPSHDDVRAIRDRIAELSGQMSALGDRQTVSMDMIRSIQTHLLDNDS